jgi:hypothetical protein
VVKGSHEQDGLVQWGRSSWLSKRAKVKNDQKFLYILGGHFRFLLYIVVNWRFRRRRKKKFMEEKLINNLENARVLQRDLTPKCL